MNLHLFRALSIALVSVLAVGCASTVKVTSDPPGAVVRARGSGRASYRWKTEGKTPCEFKTYYSTINACVQWPDGTISEIKRVPMPLFSHPEPLNFKKP